MMISFFFFIPLYVNQNDISESSIRDQLVDGLYSPLLTISGFQALHWNLLQIKMEQDCAYLQPYHQKVVYLIKAIVTAPVFLDDGGWRHW